MRCISIRYIHCLDNIKKRMQEENEERKKKSEKGLSECKHLRLNYVLFKQRKKKRRKKKNEKKRPWVGK